MNWRFWEKSRKETEKAASDDPIRNAPPPVFLKAGYLELSSPTWGFVSNWAESQIFNARQKNDAVSLTVEQTAALRGEIRAFKRLLDLAKPQEPVGAEQVED